MKKWIAGMLAVLLLSMTAWAQEGIPEALMEQPMNFTAGYSISVTFDNSDEITVLADVLEYIGGELENIDAKLFLQTALSYDGKMLLQADFSEDFKKMRFGLTTETDQALGINQNLHMDVRAKSGIWGNWDFSDAQNPVFDIVFSSPISSKYIKFSAADFAETDLLSGLQTMLNAEILQTNVKKASEMLLQHATVSTEGNTIAIRMDNAGFTAYLDAYIQSLAEITASVPEISAVYAEFPSFASIQLLGEGGVQSICTLENGKIAMEKSTVDISVGIAQIYETMTGMEWEEGTPSTMDFTLSVEGQISKRGTTTVNFPVLTEDNHITMEDLMPDYTAYEPDGEFDEYPNFFVSGYTDTLPIYGNEIFLPLRATLEDAYGENVEIIYNHGSVMLKSKYFPVDTVLLEIGTETVYAGGVPYTMGKAMLVDGSTYVSSRLFTDVFGWELASVSHEILDNTYYYSFCTSSF